MNFDEYREIYDALLDMDEDFETVVLPIELEPGETQEEGIIRFLLDEDLIEEHEEEWVIKDRDRFRIEYPNLLKLLDSRIKANLMAEMDELIEMGYAFMSADEDGDIIYELTDVGKQYVKED
jgi:hypothetical protein